MSDCFFESRTHTRGSRHQRNSSSCAARWTYSIAAIDDRLSLACDNEHNLVALRYNDDAETDAGKADLDRVAQFNVGDCINRIRAGGLIMQLPDAEFAACKSFVLGSVLGMISLLVLLPKHRFDQLLSLQTAMQSHIKVCAPMSSSTSTCAVCVLFRALFWRSRSQASSQVSGECMFECTRRGRAPGVETQVPSARTQAQKRTAGVHHCQTQLMLRCRAWAGCCTKTSARTARSGPRRRRST